MSYPFKHLPLLIPVVEHILWLNGRQLTPVEREIDQTRKGRKPIICEFTLISHLTHTTLKLRWREIIYDMLESLHDFRISKRRQAFHIKEGTLSFDAD